MEITDLLKQGRTREVWDWCCGFIDLTINDCMSIQRRLLMEQLALMKNCELGRYILNGTDPRTVEEFREQVPLTIYDDYAPYLLNQKEDALPAKPAVWQYTSGKSGEYPYRWVPVTERQLKEIEPLLFALAFFSACQNRNEINFNMHDTVLYGMAPPPYATGTMARVFPREMFDFLPPIEQAEKMTFEDRMLLGFEAALSRGLDLGFALSSVAVAIGERFKQQGGNSSISSWLKRPQAAVRLARGLVKSRLEHRQLLPKDLWKLKGLITFGIDSSVYRERIKEFWGIEPLEFHGCTEAVLLSMQTWDHRSLTFIPHLNFLEFIPGDESIRARTDPAYQPSTLLLDELVPGKYELVITSFQGGPFMRYRLGHLVEITSLRNDKLDIDIPQMVFLGRVDDQLDIAGFTRLSEKVIWQAIENSGLAYEGWTACKETNGEPALRLYIELKENGISAEQVATMVHRELRKLDTPYAELESFTGLKPLKVTLLPASTFTSHEEYQRRNGAELMQLRPPHINPPDEMIALLLSHSAPIEADARAAIKV
ncbi:MAG: GH3 auxin-responsive promoter family protein [Chloroflexi bacterium]|nr:GH3 auxin-responsive promoter family protein [Chloroflexota bacterium]